MDIMKNRTPSLYNIASDAISQRQIEETQSEESSQTTTTIVMGIPSPGTGHANENAPITKRKL
jgi:hypothetical protein